VSGCLGGESVITILSPGLNSGLKHPAGVTVNPNGDIYIADTGNNSIKLWQPSTKQITTLASGLDAPSYLAVDVAGNVYFSDAVDNTIKEWSSSTKQATTLFSTGVNIPSGVLVDQQGAVYYGIVTEPPNLQIVYKWTSANQRQIEVAVVEGEGPVSGIAIDALSNLYFTLAGQVLCGFPIFNGFGGFPGAGPGQPGGVAVDGKGNVYMADIPENSVLVWNPMTQQESTLALPGLNAPAGVFVDSKDSIYVADTGNSAIKKITNLFVSANSFAVAAAAGSGKLGILPASIQWTATSQASWLTVPVSGTGTVAFQYSKNTTGAQRQTTFTVLGLQFSVIQEK
jgi:streptogramin lyase